MIRFSARIAAALLACAAVVPAMAAPPEGASVVRQGADGLVVSWRAAGPVDVFLADRADAPLKAARLVSARDADGQTAIDHVTGARPYVLLRNATTGEVTRTAERVIPLEAGSNFRDIGGYPAARGRHVRWGLIYRSGATPLITSADRSRLAALGLVGMVDLRSDEERVLAPSRIEGVPYTAVGYSMAALMGGADAGANMGLVYRRLPAMMAPHLRQIFKQLLRGEGPLAYNCSAGQDRTGFATAIVLSVLGTPYQTIVEDYHLSTLHRRPANEMPRLDPALQAVNPVAALFGRYQDDPRYQIPQPLKTVDGTAYLDFAFAQMSEQWGGVDGYLHKELGLTDRDIARLRALYTI